MKMSEKKKMVLNWMKMCRETGYRWRWVSPTEIGINVFGKESYNASGFISPICKALVKDKLIERNSRGWYRVKP